MIQAEINEILHHIEVEKAYIDGKTIERMVRETKGGWVKVAIPSWDWKHCDYRVKPQYRPFENVQEVMEAIKEHGDIVLSKCSTVYRKIIAFNPCDVYFGAAKSIEYKDAYETYIFADGTPFGKLNEE